VVTQEQEEQMKNDGKQRSNIEENSVEGVDRHSS